MLKSEFEFIFQNIGKTSFQFIKNVFLYRYFANIGGDQVGNVLIQQKVVCYRAATGLTCFIFECLHFTFFLVQLSYCGSLRSRLKLIFPTHDLTNKCIILYIYIHIQSVHSRECNLQY